MQHLISKYQEFLSHRPEWPIEIFWSSKLQKYVRVSYKYWSLEGDEVEVLEDIKDVIESYIDDIMYSAVDKKEYAEIDDHKKYLNDVAERYWDAIPPTYRRYAKQCTFETIRKILDDEKC